MTNRLALLGFRSPPGVTVRRGVFWCGAWACSRDGFVVPRLLRAAGGLGCLVAGLGLLAGAGAIAAEGQQRVDEEYFEKHIRPIFAEKCGTCHSGPKAGGGLSLDSREGWEKGGDSGPAIVPGKAEESLVIKAVSGADPDWRMPPEDEGDPLTADEVARLREWVAGGAFDPRVAGQKIGGMNADEAKAWWSFQPLPAVERPITPAEIDAPLDAAIKARGLEPNGPADARTLIRRATYDLTGLPPSSAEVEAFANDPAPDRFERLIDRLLASPEYGVHWGRHWLDVVRYADTAGENSDRPLPHAWRYRNWVCQAFNDDMPYDEFVRLQVAGDILRAGEGTPRRDEAAIATGYLANARRFGHAIAEDMHLTHEDLIDNLGKNFLGLTIACARCHDHKFDPVSNSDYYALYGIFESTRLPFPGSEGDKRIKDLVPLVDSEGAASLQDTWHERLEARRKEVERRKTPEFRKDLKLMVGSEVTVLAAGLVGEGQSVPIVAAENRPIVVPVRKGEVLQLSIAPNAHADSDTTKIELSIEEIGGAQASWSHADLIDMITAGNPLVVKEAGWSFFSEADQAIDLLDGGFVKFVGHSELRGWSYGDGPLAIANTAEWSVDAWTPLAARSLFLRPGHGERVAMAWVCPRDGEYRVGGVVTDVHPAGLDGVSFTLDHRASVKLGDALASPLPPEAGPFPDIPWAYAVAEGKAANAKIQQRGEPTKPGDEVARRWLEVFGGQPVAEASGSGRRELAEWIVGNPLAARVIVNRIWQWHFGAGLVRTANDFGTRGELPSHPELLDRLAADFMADGGRFKRLHRILMLTSAYRRASTRTPQIIEIDPENRLLARFERRRLTAEEIRDSLLLAAGRLDTSPGEGHPFPPEATWSFSQHEPFHAVYDSTKRSVYLMTQRQRRHPFLSLFDGADPNASTATRQTTTVPTQALYFLNDPFFHEQAAALARRVLAEPDPDPSRRIDRIFAIALQRAAGAEEREVAMRLLETYPGGDEEKWAAVARVMLASSEFVHVD